MALTFKESLAYFWQQIVAQFVRKENGKGLSSNDFTTEEKEKLASAVLSVDGTMPDENGNVELDRSNPIPFIKQGNSIRSGISFAEAADICKHNQNQVNATLAATSLNSTTREFQMDTSFASWVQIVSNMSTGEDLYISLRFEMKDGSVVKLQFNPDETITEIADEETSGSVTIASNATLKIEEGAILDTGNALVKSVANITPDNNGNVPLCLVKNVCIVDGSAISPDILQYMGINTMAEIVGWLRNKGTHSVIFHRDIMGVNGETIEEVKDTGSDILRQEDGTYNAIVYFGDDLCPIILDSKNNKIYFDPDWVAPAQSVKSVNGITPNENGRLNTAVIIENDESTGNVSIIRNPDLLWRALQSDLSASDISIFQRVAYEEDNSQDYLMINNELESLVYSQTDEIVVEIWRLGFGGHAPDLLVDNVAHTVSIDPDWVALKIVESTNDAAAYQQLVTDGEGNKIWEDKLCYTEEQNIVFVEQTTVSGRFGQFVTISEWPLKEASTYTVTYNGETYECTPILLGGQLSLGNAKLYSASLSDTGEPFLITGIAPGMSSYCFFSSSQTHTFSVNGPADVITKIPSKYLEPNIVPGSGFGSVVLAGGEASGQSAVAENGGTANGASSHAENASIANGHYSHAEGMQTIASSNYQHVQGQYNIEDANNTYAHIVGNGSYNARSNAHTVNWNGTGWFAGDIYVGGAGQNDENAKKLATEEYVGTQLSSFAPIQIITWGAND